MSKIICSIVFVAVSFLGVNNVSGNMNCSSVEALSVLTSEKHSISAKEEALKCILKLEDVSALPYIVEELDNIPFDPSMYIKVIGELGGEEEKDFLLAFWNRLEIEIKEKQKKNNYQYLVDSKVYLIDALHSLGDHSLLEELYIMAYHKSKGVRYYTANALGRVGNERAVTILRDMALNDPMRLPRYGAVNALMKMGDLEIFDEPDDFVAGGYITQDEADQIRRERKEKSVE